MRVIRKGRPPKGLTEYRAEPVGTSYGNLRKEEVREALAKEQGYLCAYCMGRIAPDKDHMKIDHREAQKSEGGGGKAIALVYKNMLGVCKGGEGLARKHQHCDTYKKNRPLKIDPTDAQSGWERTVRYGAGGNIASSLPALETDLNEILNLNVDSLKEARRSAVQGALSVIGRESPGEWSEAVVRRAIARFEEPDAGGRLSVFCEAVLYFLRKRLAHAPAPRTRARARRRAR